MTTLKRSALFLGPLLAVLCPALIDIPAHPQAPFMLGIALWMSIWWLTECVPLAVTALIPLVAFPLTGIATATETAPRYMTSIMFLFVGGFLISQSLERTGLHRRIALNVLSRFHHSPFQILLGFALGTAFLSMWISNTATALLMVTIAITVIGCLDRVLDAKAMAVMSTTLLLAIAYAANIGGMGTPVGTVPNLVFLEIIRGVDPGKVPSFMQWMMIGVPLVIVGLAVVLYLLNRRVRRIEWTAGSFDHLDDELHELSKIRPDERFVAWLFGLTALAWMTREGIKGDGFSIPGWSALLPYKGIDDGTVAMFSALLLFLIPVQQGKPILRHEAIGKLPWEILILLGGGFALAMGMKSSGLSHWVGEQMGFLAGVPLPVTLLCIALAITFLTEITSNTATTQVMLPILAAVALAGNFDVTDMLLVATFSASCAFMLPVATPPNAIIFATGHVKMEDMVKVGIRLNLIMPFVVVAVILLLRPVFP